MKASKWMYVTEMKAKGSFKAAAAWRKVRMGLCAGSLCAGEWTRTPLKLQVHPKDIQAHRIQSLVSIRAPEWFGGAWSTSEPANADLQQAIWNSPSAIKASVLSPSAEWAASGDKPFKERRTTVGKKCSSLQGKTEEETVVHTGRKTWGYGCYWRIPGLFHFISWFCFLFFCSFSRQGLGRNPLAPREVRPQGGSSMCPACRGGGRRCAGGWRAALGHEGTVRHSGAGVQHGGSWDGPAVITVCLSVPLSLSGVASSTLIQPGFLCNSPVFPKMALCGRCLLRFRFVVFWISWHVSTYLVFSHSTDSGGMGRRWQEGFIPLDRILLPSLFSFSSQDHFLSIKHSIKNILNIFVSLLCHGFLAVAWE